MINIVGAIAGAVVGAVVGAAVSVVTDAARGKPINWKRAGAAALGGAAAGAITVATFGAAAPLAAKIGGLTLAGASAGATEQVADNAFHDRPWHQDVAKNTAIGAAAGGALGGAGRLLAPVARHGGRLLSSAAGRGRTLLSAGRQQGGALGQRALSLTRQAWGGGRAKLQAAGSTTKRLWGRYLDLLERAPIRTKSATSSVIMAGGDMIAQGIEGKGFDWKRTAMMSAFGAIWVGPGGHYWFAGLARLFPGTAARAVVGRVAVDQIVMAPFGTALFFTASGAMQGGSPREIWDGVKQNFWPTLKANYMVWPGVQAVNFRFVPQSLQVAFGNVVSLGWTAYISAMANSSEPEAEAKGVQAKGVQANGVQANGVELPSELAAAPAEGEGLVETLSKTLR